MEIIFYEILHQNLNFDKRINQNSFDLLVSKISDDQLDQFAKELAESLKSTNYREETALYTICKLSMESIRAKGRKRKDSRDPEPLKPKGLFS